MVKLAAVRVSVTPDGGVVMYLETVPKFKVAAGVPEPPSVTPAGSVLNRIPIADLLISVAFRVPDAFCATVGNAHERIASPSSNRDVRVVCIVLIRRRSEQNHFRKSLRRHAVLHAHVQCFRGSAVSVRRLQSLSSGRHAECVHEPGDVCWW